MSDTPLVSAALRAEEYKARHAALAASIKAIDETDDEEEEEAAEMVAPPSMPLVEEQAAADAINAEADAKCHIKNCCKSAEGLLTCVSEKCSRQLHESCFIGCVFIKMKPDMADEVKAKLEPAGAVACTVGCFKDHCKQVRAKVRAEAKAAAAANSTSTLGLYWDNDGATGKEDPNNSLSILIAWLQKPGNFSRYRGKDNNGTRKKDFAFKIATLCNLAGVKVKRDAKQVQSKIDHLLKQFKTAKDWASNTGVGVRASDEDGFHATIRKICPNWDDLEEVIGDRALARAAFSSDDLDDDTPTDEDENGGDDDDDDEAVLDDDDEEALVANLDKKDSYKEQSEFGSDIDDEAEEESGDLLAPLYSNDENSGNKKKHYSTKKKVSKKKAASTPLALPSSKKPKTKKAKEDEDLSASLFGSSHQKAYYEDAKRRRARELRMRVAEYEEHRRHNAAMERAALPPNLRVECYREFQSIKNEPWASDAVVKTMFPPEIAQQCIAMRNAVRAPEEFDEDGNNLYEG